MPESLSVIGSKMSAEATAVPQAAAAGEPPTRLGSGFDLEQHVQDIEREYIAEALRRAGGVKVRAAELLGMSFRSFRYYTKKYNL
jgi:two-component system response regulator PilR (NtrC family)